MGHNLTKFAKFGRIHTFRVNVQSIILIVVCFKVSSDRSLRSLAPSCRPARCRSLGPTHLQLCIGCGWYVGVGGMWVWVVWGCGWYAGVGGMWGGLYAGVDGMWG